eukprot:6805576-Pyramimonas_sp.AAC.1
MSVFWLETSSHCLASTTALRTQEEDGSCSNGTISLSCMILPLCGSESWKDTGQILFKMVLSPEWPVHGTLVFQRSVSRISA